MFSSRRIFYIAVSVLFVVLVGGFVLWRLPINRQKITLTFWSVFDDSDAYAGLIQKFHEQYPWITINYKKWPYDEYEKNLLKAWSLGQGPDIFSVHNTWVARPSYKSYIYPLPQGKKTMTAEDYQKTFMPVASQDFLVRRQIYAIPLAVDTLALYYNQDIFEDYYHSHPDDAWILNPPKTWSDLIKTVEAITQKDEWGNLGRAGIALGTANNINRASDILSLLMLQTGTQMVSSDHLSATFDRSTTLNGEAYNPGQRALKFYTEFANPRKKVYTWNIQRDYSVDEFSEGKVAMMIGYSYLRDIIKKKNPNLNFKVATVPQIKESPNPINYANYWGQTVSRFSQHPKEAWQFLLFCAQQNNLAFYLQTSDRPTSRIDLVSWQTQQMPELAVFAQQALSAQTWYQVDNNAIEKIFLDMITKVNYGSASTAQAISDAAKEITLMMQPPPQEPKPIKMPFEF